MKKLKAQSAVGYMRIVRRAWPMGIMAIAIVSWTVWCFFDNCAWIMGMALIGFVPIISLFMPNAPHEPTPNHDDK